MQPTHDPIFDKWQKEQRYLEEQKKLAPELFLRTQGLGVKEQLARVGIVLPSEDLSQGFIKYHPFDFVVEEIRKDGSVINVDTKTETQAGSGLFVSADLVKVGISTMDAVRELANKFQVKETQIGYGGVKDAIALTAQRISFSGVSAEQLLSLPPGNFFLKNIWAEQEAISMNNISGNRFTIFVRTVEPVNEQLLEQRLAELNQNGFWNFYWLQRFGNRLLSHWWGMLICQGKIEKMTRSFLCDPGPNELPFFSQLRTKANAQFENWEEMIKLYESLPYTMRYELLLLNYLKEFRHDYVGALRTISEQVKLWVYAYGSFLFNKVVSYGSAGQIDLPPNIPLLLSNNPKDHEIYHQFLEMDRIPLDFAQNLKRFDFIRFVSRKVETKITAKVLGYKVLPEGVVICFDLSKGAYATTFLSHIFSLDSQISSQVKSNLYDLKEVLGLGSLAETKQKLEKYIVTRKIEEPE